jgi:hypothetical protein
MRVACSVAIDWRRGDFTTSVGDNNLFHMLFVRYCVAQCAVEVVEV